MQYPRRINDEIRGQGVAGRFIKVRDQEPSEPATQCGYKNHEIEQAVNWRAQLADAITLAGGGFWVAGEIARDEANEHEDDDGGSNPHVKCQGAELARIRIRYASNDEITEAELQADHNGEQPVQGDEERVIARDGHVVLVTHAVKGDKTWPAALNP